MRVEVKDSDTVTACVQCVICKRDYSFDVPVSEWRTYSSGALIQTAMPSVGKDSRELLISGTCGACFEHLFS